MEDRVEARSARGHGGWRLAARVRGAENVLSGRRTAAQMAWRMVSGRTKATELERLLPWAWKAERLAAAVHG